MELFTLSCILNVSRRLLYDLFRFSLFTTGPAPLSKLHPTRLVRPKPTPKAKATFPKAPSLAAPTMAPLREAQEARGSQRRVVRTITANE